MWTVFPFLHSKQSCTCVHHQRDREGSVCEYEEEDDLMLCSKPWVWREAQVKRIFYASNVSKRWVHVKKISVTITGAQFKTEPGCFQCPQANIIVFLVYQLLTEFTFFLHRGRPTIGGFAMYRGPQPRVHGEPTQRSTVRWDEFLPAYITDHLYVFSW